MFKYIFIAVLILVSFSCQTQQAQKADNIAESKVDSMSNSMTNSKLSESSKNINELVDTFTDDSQIGAPHKNKIELSNFKKVEFYGVELKFYSLTQDKQWKLKQSINLDSATLYLNPKLKDFNNDGFKDLTYESALAGRGANEIRRLFIYDNINDELIYIKNSEDYPNLMYNKTLNCLDAQRFYGGTATDFVRVEGDILREFARVATSGTERKVYLIDKNGKEKLLRTDKVNEDQLFERYKTFDPPIPYTTE